MQEQQHSFQIILAAEQQPFADFKTASFMRDQLNKIAPEYSFIVSEYPQGGFVVQPSQKPRPSKPAEPQPATPTAPPHLAKPEPGNKISESAKQFFDRSPITLRPAWRNFYIRLPISIFGFTLAFLSEILIKAYLPGQTVSYLYTKLPLLPSLVFWLILGISFYHFVIILKEIYSNTYTITPEGIKGREGIIARDARTIKFKDIRSVALEQSIFERFLGVGTLEFYTAGYEGADVVFYKIAKPTVIRDYLDEYVNANR